MAFLSHVKWLYREFGLNSLYDTGRDAWLIILARCMRMVAFGTNSLILALFFSSLKFSDSYIGLFMTLTLIGDVLLSLLLTLVADRIGRRRVLFCGSVLMVISGAVFAYFENYWILLIAAVLGVISATGSDFGPFRAIEESILSGLTKPNTRAEVIAWYVTTATLGQSVGTEVAGRIVHHLQGREGWTLVDAYHGVFWMYSAMGGLNMVMMLLLSDKCEVKKKEEADDGEDAEGLLDGEEGELEEGQQSPMTPNTPTSQTPITSKPPKQKFFAQISKDTRSSMYKLWALLLIDSLADGMVPLSLTNYYLDQKFHLKKSTLGDITSAAYFLGFFGTIFAGPLSRRLGLVNTMVFTHLPSSAAVLLFSLPNNVPMCVILLLIRMGLNNMDQAPRTSLIAAIVRPEERTAIMGITSMLRTLASTTGPTVTGVLAGRGRFWIAFVVAGALRIAYDLGLWAIFVNLKLHVHEEEKDGNGEVQMRQIRDSGRERMNDEEELGDLVGDSDDESESGRSSEDFKRERKGVDLSDGK
ncbi:related to Staphylococcus multidrug resistance protein [Phialocephala subalpina]|uniref:Related to Staphylococcus multidrug resistance protein n=1 Tax=Phialocephala subalpina TaxID=576137 RepID=A0A1L7X202_9HELO|nr:related to Staphylococcus multidrug resistance protein [Phialocephala subalpina]